MSSKQNTESFQKEFPNVYQDFFGKCKTVVSTDCTFWVTWGAGWREGAPIVVQKTPYRIYVGIENIDQSGYIGQGDSIFFNTLSQTFSFTDYSLISWEKSIPILTEIINNKTGLETFGGIRIHLLSEQPYYTADSPDVFMAIVCAIYNHFGFCETKTIHSLRVTSSKDLFTLTNNQTELFREMHNAAKRIIEVTIGGRACGDEAYASFVQSKTPLIYSVDEINNKEHVVGISLKEIADVQGEFPFDVVSIDVGQGFLWPSPEYNFAGSLRQMLNELQTRVIKLFDPEKIGSNTPRFVSDGKVTDYYWKLFCESLLLKPIHFLDCLIALYRQPTRSSAISECLESLESMASANAPFEEMPSSHMQHIVRKLKDLAERNGVPIACMFVCAGKTEGNVMVFVQRHALRNEILEEIRCLKEEYDPNIAMGFVSWRDGWGNGDGCLVEQNEKEGIYSPFLKSLQKIIRYNEDGSSTISSVEHGKIDVNMSDVVIDAINNEIYVLGTTVDSKVLPTKKATIDLLKVLFESQSHSVSNKDLKRSVYTSSRNDMQGKIVGPLVRFVEDRLKKEFQLKVEGELTSFFITWRPGGFTVALITKY